MAVHRNHVQSGREAECDDVRLDILYYYRCVSISAEASRDEIVILMPCNLYYRTT